MRTRDQHRRSEREADGAPGRERREREDVAAEGEVAQADDGDPGGAAPVRRRPAEDGGARAGAAMNSAPRATIPSATARAGGAPGRFHRPTAAGNRMSGPPFLAARPWNVTHTGGQRRHWLRDRATASWRR
jgi:hypothetical protein